jgi:hypothetical protein
VAGFIWSPRSHALYTAVESDTVVCCDPEDVVRQKEQGLVPVQAAPPPLVSRLYGEMYISGRFFDRKLNYENGAWERRLKLCQDCMQEYLLDSLDRIEKALRSV